MAQRHFVHHALKQECKPITDFMLYKIGNSVYSFFARCFPLRPYLVLPRSREFHMRHSGCLCQACLQVCFSEFIMFLGVLLVLCPIGRARMLSPSIRLSGAAIGFQGRGMPSTRTRSRPRRMDGWQQPGRNLVCCSPSSLLFRQCRSFSLWWLRVNDGVLYVHRPQLYYV